MGLADGFAAVGDAAARAEQQARLLTAAHIAQLARAVGIRVEAASTFMREQCLQVEVVQTHAADDDTVAGCHLGEGSFSRQTLWDVEPAGALCEGREPGTFLGLRARDVADREDDGRGDDGGSVLAADQLRRHGFRVRGRVAQRLDGREIDDRFDRSRVFDDRDEVRCRVADASIGVAQIAAVESPAGERGIDGVRSALISIPLCHVRTEPIGGAIRGDERTAGIGEDRLLGDRRVHQQGLGLIRAPDDSRTRRMGIDEVDDDRGRCICSRESFGGEGDESLEDRESARTGADDRHRMGLRVWTVCSG